MQKTQLLERIKYEIGIVIMFSESNMKYTNTKIIREFRVYLCRLCCALSRQPKKSDSCRQPHIIDLLDLLHKRTASNTNFKCQERKGQRQRQMSAGKTMTRERD